VGAFAETVTQSMPVPPGGGRSGKLKKVVASAESRDVDLIEPAGTEAAVSTEAAESFIEGKRIGERIKYLRQRKHLGLVEVGKHTGLSASFLSQLETGRVVPTLRNLARIAMVFSKDMSYFFEPERTELFRILRSSNRQKLPQTGVDEPGYYFESLGQVPSDQPIAPYVAEFLPTNERRPARTHQHPGNEFLYVLNGRMRLEHEGKSEALSSGDAVFFNAEAVHSYQSAGDSSCTALILTMPEPLRGAHSGSKLPLSPTDANKGQNAVNAARK
jgi:transcriptional regulator with XRE-family HTH domain